MIYQLDLQKKPLTRAERRTYNREVQRCMTFIDHVETNFLRQLFEENAFSYPELFNFYNKLWIQGCMHMDINMKLKIVKPNYTYFEEIYNS